MDVRQLLAEQKQNGGNQRAGVADADPPHEIDDGPTPHHRVLNSPDAHACGHEVENHRESKAIINVTLMPKADLPPSGRFAFDDAGDPVGNPAGAAVVGHQRNALQFRRRRLHAQLWLVRDQWTVG